MTEEQESRTVDIKDLKIQAYKESNSRLEEANADLRVEVTVLNIQLNEANRELESLRGSDEVVSEKSPDPNEGE